MDGKYDEGKPPVMGFIMWALLMGMIAFAAVAFFTGSLLFGLLAYVVGGSTGFAAAVVFLKATESHSR